MFKSDFKYYKSRNPPPSLDNVINFNNLNSTNIHKVKHFIIKDQINKNKIMFGMKPLEQWNCYELVDNPGLIFIQNPFTSLGQRYWIVNSLKNYSNKPNKTNLDVHNIIPNEKEWWSYSQEDINNNILKKLRWATLGYHHNWDTKIYSDDMRDVFPEDLSLLCNYVTNALGFVDFKAEAAIINYYHMDSTLSGHTDHSEVNLEAPLLSFSFGQTSLFLLGGQTIAVKPTALFLHSGDIVVMSKESRLCYHGVPRIVPSVDESWNEHCEKLDNGNEKFDQSNLDICCDESLWGPFGNYLTFSRININVRQVLNHSQVKLK